MIFKADLLTIVLSLVRSVAVAGFKKYLITESVVHYAFIKVVITFSGKKLYLQMLICNIISVLLKLCQNDSLLLTLKALNYRTEIVTRLKLCLAIATHNFKCVKITCIFFQI